MSKRDDRKHDDREQCARHATHSSGGLRESASPSGARGDEPLTSSPDEALRTHEERDAAREQVEGWKDQLTSLMGRYLAGQPDAPGYDDPRFLDWLARDARALSGDDQLPPETVRRVRERILRRAVAIRSGVRPVGAAAPLRPAQAVGPLAEVLETAARARLAPKIPQPVAAGVGRDLWEEACEEWVEIPPEVPAGRFVALAVAGESMMPLLHPGDVVLVRLGPEVARDAVVVARHPDDGYVVKRVGAVGRREIELLSLNPDFAPVRVPRDERTVVGTVVLRWCEHEGGTQREH